MKTLRRIIEGSLVGSVLLATPGLSQADIAAPGASADTLRLLDFDFRSRVRQADLDVRTPSLYSLSAAKEKSGGTEDDLTLKWSISTGLGGGYTSNPSNSFLGGPDSGQLTPSGSVDFLGKKAGWVVKGTANLIFDATTASGTPDRSYPGAQLDVSYEGWGNIAPHVTYTVTGVNGNFLDGHFVTFHDVFASLMSQRIFELGNQETVALMWQVGYERREATLVNQEQHRPKLILVLQRPLSANLAFTLSQMFEGQFYSASAANDQEDLHLVTTLTLGWQVQPGCAVAFTAMFQRFESNVAGLDYSVINIGPRVNFTW